MDQETSIHMRTLKSDIRSLHQIIENSTTVRRYQLEDKLQNLTVSAVNSSPCSAILKLLELKQHLNTAIFAQALERNKTFDEVYGMACYEQMSDSNKSPEHWPIFSQFMENYSSPETQMSVQLCSRFAILQRVIALLLSGAETPQYVCSKLNSFSRDPAQLLHAVLRSELN